MNSDIELIRYLEEALNETTVIVLHPPRHKYHLFHNLFFFNRNDGTIAPLRLLLALLCPIVVITTLYLLNIKIFSSYLISYIKAIIQLIIIIYVLLGLIFSNNNIYINIIYVLALLLIASFDIMLQQKRLYAHIFIDIVISLLLGSVILGLMLIYFFICSGSVNNSRLVIPIISLILTMLKAPLSVTLNSYLYFIQEDKYEIELRLSFGSTGYESTLPIIKKCLIYGLNNMINTVSVIGIPNIPIFIIGMIISNMDLFTILEYQIIILCISSLTSFISILLILLLAYKHITIDNSHRLISYNISYRISENKSIDIEIFNIILLLFKLLYNYIYKIFKYLSNKIYNKIPNKIPRTTKYSPIDHEDQSHIEISTNLDTSTHLLNPSYKATYKLLINSPFLKRDQNNIIDEYNNHIILDINNLNITLQDHLLLFDYEGISLSLHLGERISIEGVTFDIKSKLLRCIAGLDDLYSGFIELNNIINDNDNTMKLSIENDNSKQTSKSIIRNKFNINNSKLYQITYHRSRCIYLSPMIEPIIGSPAQFILECLDFNCRKNLLGSSVIRNSFEIECNEVEKSLSLNKGQLQDNWTTLSESERQRAIIACALIIAKVYMYPLNNHDNNNSTIEDISQPPIVFLLDQPTYENDLVTALLIEKAIIISGISAIIITEDSKQAERLCHKRLIMSNIISDS